MEDISIFREDNLLFRETIVMERESMLQPATQSDVRIEELPDLEEPHEVQEPQARQIMQSSAEQQEQRELQELQEPEEPQVTQVPEESIITKCAMNIVYGALSSNMMSVLYKSIHDSEYPQDYKTFSHLMNSKPHEAFDSEYKCLQDTTYNSTYHFEYILLGMETIQDRPYLNFGNKQVKPAELPKWKTANGVLSRQPPATQNNFKDQNTQAMPIERIAAYRLAKYIHEKFDDMPRNGPNGDNYINSLVIRSHYIHNPMYIAYIMGREIRPQESLSLLRVIPCAFIKNITHALRMTANLTKITNASYNEIAQNVFIVHIIHKIIHLSDFISDMEKEIDEALHYAALYMPQSARAAFVKTNKQWKYVQLCCDILRDIYQHYIDDDLYNDVEKTHKRMSAIYMHKMGYDSVANIVIGVIISLFTGVCPYAQYNKYCAAIEKRINDFVNVIEQKS